MRAPPPDDVRERLEDDSAPGLSAEAVWHERLRRRMAPGNFDARYRSLVHELLAIESGMPRRLEVVNGRCRWHPIPTDREREARRAWDELGRTLGVGPMP